MASIRRSGVAIGPGSHLALGSYVEPGTQIGHHTNINGPATIKGSGTAIIGPYCAIGAHLTIVTDNHDTRFPNIQKTLHERYGFIELTDIGDVMIEPACWIGDNVTVLAGVTVGAGAIIGAGAVVTKDVDPYTVVGGVPARLLRERCPRDVATALVELAWWNWDAERISQSRTFFETSLDKLRLPLVPESL